MEKRRYRGDEMPANVIVQTPIISAAHRRRTDAFDRRDRRVIADVFAAFRCRVESTVEKTLRVLEPVGTGTVRQFS